MKLVFATNNKHKIEEIENIVGKNIEILDLKEITCYEDLPENQNTIEGNALEKANYVYSNYNINCFADDTGLEVEALNGRPGVNSARYAGEDKTSEDNVNKLLHEMQGINNRNARFKTVICLIIDGNVTRFEGVIKGKLLNKKKGNNGFGYDPIFIPDGYKETFAEMSLELKNKISHRSIATQKLIKFLNIISF